jgi:undecaprenyl-diphosphatase
VFARLRVLCRFLLPGLLLALTARAAEPAPAPASAPVAELSAGDAIILGLVEGVTEFLPVSSTGHLIIANDLLGLESDRQLTDRSGRPLWYKPPSPKYPQGVPLTLKLAADTYTVIIQVGAIAAVLLLYWRQVLSMFTGLADPRSAGFRLLRNVLLAFVPVAIAGLALHDFVDRYLFSTGAVIGSAVAGAGLMFWAERWRRTRAPGAMDLQPADLPPGKAVGIGLAQCLALYPGTSRSMVTIVGGYLSGLNPVRAAEFSFLVGLPTLAGAAFYKGLKSGPAMIEVFGWGHVILGTVVAAISAALAVRFLVHFLTRHGLALFAYYRLILSLALLVFTLVRG